MMRRLNKEKLTKEDIEYIADEREGWEEVARLEQGYYEDGRRDGREEGKEEIKQGQSANQHEIVRKMLNRGYNSNEISEIYLARSQI